MKWLDKYRQSKREKNIMSGYMEILKNCRHPFKKICGVSKVGDIVHKIELNGVEIESRDPLFIKEEK